MSTWINRATLVAAILSLGGCVAGGVLRIPGTSAAPQQVSVAKGAVMVSGPEGYCVEQRASRESAEGDFVLLASCAALTGREGGASAPAILTASVSGEPGGRGPMPEAFPILADFFRTDQGRAALSRSGRVGDVEVLRSYSRGDALYLKLRDRSPASGVPVEPDYWRAILGLGGRIVTLSVLSARQRPMTDATRQNTLQAFVARMQGVNRSANAS